MKRLLSCSIGCVPAIFIVLALTISLASDSRAARRIKVDSHVQAAKCKSCPAPQYPELARRARVQGVVKVYAVIDPEGKVASYKLISGHPLLSEHALEAVRNWLYYGTVVDGESVEVETEVHITFALQ